MNYLPAHYFQGGKLVPGKLYCTSHLFNLVDSDNLYSDVNYTELFTCDIPIFLYGDPEIRKKFKSIEKELIEYVFHPRRIKYIEYLDYL